MLFKVSRMKSQIKIMPCKETIEHLPIAYLASCQTNIIGEPALLEFNNQTIKSYYYPDSNSMNVNNLRDPQKRIETSSIVASIVAVLNWLDTDMHKYNEQDKIKIQTDLCAELKRIDVKAYNVLCI